MPCSSISPDIHEPKFVVLNQMVHDIPCILFNGRYVLTSNRNIKQNLISNSLCSLKPSVRFAYRRILTNCNIQSYDKK